MRASRMALFAGMAIMSAVSRADAAPMGGVDGRTLDAWAIAGGTGAPNVVTWEDFDGTTGTDLDGQSLDGPGTWVVFGSGSWSIQANEAESTSAVASRLIVDGGTDDASVLATLTLGGAARAGLVALQTEDVMGDQFLYALYSEAAGGTVELYKRVGTDTLLASVTGVGTPGSALMELDATTDTMRVSFAGTEVLTYTLTPAEIGLFKNPGHDHFGVIADSDSLNRFDDFHVDS